MPTSLARGIGMLQKAKSKANEIWTTSAELYREMTLSALRLLPGRR
jgi:hypothetical protein